jgi:P27 family predicted phage terminase small subunit
MGNRKAPELHVVDGTKSRRGNTQLIPEELKKRIPKAYWLDNHDLWDRDKFIEDTSNFLYDVYGIGTDQDQHMLAFLVEQIELYIKCSRGIEKNGIITVFNEGKTVGPNPYITIRREALRQIIQIMNEMGLTARSRLAHGKTEDESPMAKFLAGPLAG